MSAKKLSLHHIAYNDATVAGLPPGFVLMDNTDHARDDWREYWPIRRFLLSAALDEDCYYGFLSPRFAEKTGQTFASVQAFLDQAPDDVDVIAFSPQPDMGAFFLNIFEQEELFQPGFQAVAQSFFDAIGYPVQLAGLVMDSRHVVFSNYQIARPRFWRAWLEINEKLFALCEGEDNPLMRELNSATAYPGAVPRKVFLQERICSLMLATQAGWKSKLFDTFQLAWSASRLNQFQHEAVLSDALKIAMREQGYPEYLSAFAQLRDKLR
ncbi:hypothetical protein V8J88_11040 [Massilia sp. W12]|uniref:hypothetical protein n=1 Tax=Massilia sp. W12 TaxID=3126507 RepID=UPI0030D357D2